jgi:hypothetical protein
MKQKTLTDLLGRALQRLFIVTLVIGLTLGTGPTLVAHAATIIVDSTDDSGPGSLRQAIQDAAPGDTINFSVTGTITLTSGELIITKNLNIHGPGATSLAISGNDASRVVRIDSGATVTISDITIRNGSAYWGAGIRNDGALTLMNVAVSNNHSESSGGGILNYGPLNLTNVAISGNTASGAHPLGGGGIAHFGGAATLKNVTISGNSAINTGGVGNGGSGGGISIYNPATLSLNNVTIVNNSASASVADLGTGGGIDDSQADPVNFKNTLIAGNTSSGAGPDCIGTLTSQGYNLIQSTAGCVIAGDTTGNILGQDPLLAPLAYNGGATQTHGLLPGSPAIDAGNPAAPGSGGNACEANDQRGVARPQGTRCDIGAVETYFQLYLPLILR